MGKYRHTPTPFCFAKGANIWLYNMMIQHPLLQQYLRWYVRLQENPDIFREKGPVTASWQLPRRCYGARMAFYRVLTEFLLAIICALTTLSLHFHGAHNTCNALSRRSHCADGLLKMFISTTERSLRQFYVCSRK